MLAQMNGDLESLIRNAYSKIVEENKENINFMAAAAHQEPI